MKHYLLLLIIPFAFFSCCFGLCEPSIHPKPFNFCEYNPEKARAEILQIHNFQSLFDTSLQFIYICEHAEKFYFASNINDKEITICIVDKATMTLENKVKITLEDIENEVKTYVKHMNKYGVPLDPREEYTINIWVMWTTVMTNNEEYRTKAIGALYDFINETSDRVPMTDWHCTTINRRMDFQNRSVVGGLFINLLP